MPVHQCVPSQDCGPGRRSPCSRTTRKAPAVCGRSLWPPIRVHRRLTPSSPRSGKVLRTSVSRLRPSPRTPTTGWTADIWPRRPPRGANPRFITRLDTSGSMIWSSGSRTFERPRAAPLRLWMKITSRSTLSTVFIDKPE